MVKRKKLEKVRVYQGLTRMIQGLSQTDIPFPTKYYATIPSAGVALVLRQTGNDPGIIENVPIEALAMDILKYCEHNLSDSKDFQVTKKEAIAAAEYWSYSAGPIPKPKMFLWPDEEGLAYTRLPWKQEPGPTPTWDGMLSRMTNAQAFCDMIGSLFVAESSTQNYLWVQGAGNDGKGAINRFLKKIFGNAYRTKQPPGQDTKFWTYGLIGARVVVFPDCNAKGFVAGGLFKSLTGGDPVDVEAKNQMAYTTELNCKFIFFSNEKPGISGERADLRRIIYCVFEGEGQFDPKFEEKLWAEGGAYVSKCIDGYLSRNPNHGPIDADRSAIEDWVSASEEGFETFFEAAFDLDRTGTYRTGSSVSHLTKEQLSLVVVSPEEMQLKLKEKFPSRKDELEFRAWLERTHLIKKLTVHSAAARELSSGTAKTPKFYVGMCLREKIYKSGRLSAVPGTDSGTD